MFGGLAFVNTNLPGTDVAGRTLSRNFDIFFPGSSVNAGRRGACLLTLGYPPELRCPTRRCNTGPFLLTVLLRRQPAPPPTTRSFRPIPPPLHTYPRLCCVGQGTARCPCGKRLAANFCCCGARGHVALPQLHRRPRICVNWPASFCAGALQRPRPHPAPTPTPQPTAPPREARAPHGRCAGHQAARCAATAGGVAVRSFASVTHAIRVDTKVPLRVSRRITHE